jgi:hypothetical protein
MTMRLAHFAAIALCLGVPLPATGQIGPLQLQPSRQPAPQGPRLAPFGPSPQQPNRPPPEERPPEGTPVRLTALHHEGSAPIARGVQWRIYADQPDTPGALRFVTEATESQPNLRLPPGGYIVNASYGRASLTRRLMVGQVSVQDTFILNAGGLRLAATVGARRLPDSRVTYAVYTGPGPGGAAVLDSVRGGRILRLPVGDYHVVSRYGDANAIMAGDVRVQPGRLTEATLHHRAAQVTLKLVSEAGGEAIANTAWSVLTPGGDAVQESIGAFPSMVLAAGDYTVIARNEGRVYSARFSVEVGRDREVEVLAR